MALIAIVHRSGDVQTIDTEEDQAMIVMALSLKERHTIVDAVVQKFEREKMQGGETNNIMHVFASARIKTADDDSAYRKKQYSARWHLMHRNNFRKYMGEELKSPNDNNEAPTTLIMPTSRIITPDGA